MRYLVDTDWIAYYLRGHRRVTDLLISFRRDGIAVSMISLAELYEGICRSSDPVGDETDLRNFLTGVFVLSIDDNVCRIFGQERSILRKQGLLIGDFDILIASTALYYNLTVLTNNRKHFERIEGLQIIST
ncbi:MAG: type II toxin-antitoxin system VapC family toxin [Nitrospirae bacterium]|nr:type II toxin-antitoxin system VapC family toxin [Nitrospirota bacterium]